ncbi:Maf family protein [Marinicella litoralis]|uniref:7-methyl-GTP pyrophosphatase n=1 Tax=Marinicella litoralis TaxID=644220 RepID=A0A4R6XJD3_9GAMM|nr:nucleoside triphosphate pyrophosphatase [Marinicella litoralis]TDR19612.1 septum formation protein [Marinicella litoralis]
MTVDHAPIVLASSSVYRQQQLQSLGLKFVAMAPDINEVAKAKELPEPLAARLACEKAQKIKALHPASCVIGSDQVCTFDGQAYGKPGGVERAIEQLQTFSNNCVEFFTALCVLSPAGEKYGYIDRTVVNFRTLNDAEILRYIEKEMPLNCAGAFKVESLGLSLFTSVTTTDPSALMGLPLIKLGEFLRLSGYQIP